MIMNQVYWSVAAVVASLLLLYFMPKASWRDAARDTRVAANFPLRTAGWAGLVVGAITLVDGLLYL